MTASRDLIIGLAANYTWENLEPFACSIVQSGFLGDKVLFVKNLTAEATDHLIDLGFRLIPVPKMANDHFRYFPYVGRFLLIHQFLSENPGYRFVFCADTRDLVFQHNPSTWMEKHIGAYNLVAASEFCRHRDSSPCMGWVNDVFSEVKSWMEQTTIYCSGFVAGRADYVRDLSLGIYLGGRYLTPDVWGADQPVMNTILHQKAYADATLVPKMSDRYCINCVNLAARDLRKNLQDSLSIRPFITKDAQLTRNLNLLWNDGIPDLSDFTILHQYDRIPELKERVQRRHRLLKLNETPFDFDLSQF